MSDHEISELRREIQELKDLVKPIAESYAAVTKLGTWAKYGLYIVATILGIILTLKQLKK